MKKFYDTCALLNAGERAFAEPFLHLYGNAA